MSPMLKKVEKAGQKGIAAKRKPYKIGPDDFFHDTETLRLLFARLIKDESVASRCVTIPSVSYGMANVAKNLDANRKKIIIVEDQFPSNVYPWESFEVVVVKQPEDTGLSWTEAIIEKVDENVAAVCIGQVHWVDGHLYDLQAIREVTSKVGAALVIDATQSLGAYPFDVKQIKPDALVTAGYKWLFGPYGLGMAYFGEMFDDGRPIENNWINRKDSENFGGLVNYTEKFQPGALRYEVGEHSNFILVPMLIEALKQVLKWEPEAIQKYVSELASPAIETLREKGYLIADNKHRAAHLFGIRFAKGMDPDKIRKSLDQHRVNVSFRGNAIRVSPQVYNDQKDINRLLRALTSFD